MILDSPVGQMTLYGLRIMYTRIYKLYNILLLYFVRSFIIIIIIIIPPSSSSVPAVLAEGFLYFSQRKPHWYFTIRKRFKTKIPVTGPKLVSRFNRRFSIYLG